MPAILSKAIISSNLKLSIRGMNINELARNMHAICIYKGVHINHHRNCTAKSNI